MGESFLNWTRITTQAPNNCRGASTRAEGGAGAASIGPWGTSPRGTNRSGPEHGPKGMLR